MTKLWYLAHPYTSPHREQENFESACQFAAALLEAGFYVYSPISHTHPLHQYMGIMTKEEEYALYLPFGKEFAKRCDGLILAPAWAGSRGCREEYAWFREWKRPIYTIIQSTPDSSDFALGALYYRLSRDTSGV